MSEEKPLQNPEEEQATELEHLLTDLGFVETEQMRKLRMAAEKLAAEMRDLIRSYAVEASQVSEAMPTTKAAEANIAAELAMGMFSQSASRFYEYREYLRWAREQAKSTMDARINKGGEIEELKKAILALNNLIDSAADVYDLQPLTTAIPQPPLPDKGD